MNSALESMGIADQYRLRWWQSGRVAPNLGSNRINLDKRRRRSPIIEKFQIWAKLFENVASIGTDEEYDKVWKLGLVRILI